MRRAAERSEVASHAAPLGRPEIAVALFACLVAAAINLLAFVTDLQAFQAVASPALVSWLVLCVLCSLGLGLVVYARRSGIQVPLYFRALLGIGALLAGALALSPAIRVLSKDSAKSESPVPRANLILRNQTVRDTSFAGRQLRHSDFSGATLLHVDFDGADLSESDFRDATIRDSNLSGATLCGVDIRGADLRGARGLTAVEDWSYVFYNGRTQVPPRDRYLLELRPGPIADTGRDLLYSCSPDLVRRIQG